MTDQTLDGAAEEGPTSWRDLLVRLQSAIADGDEDAVADVSHRLLDGDFDATEGAADDAAVSAVPEGVLATVRTVRLKALLRLSRHDEVIKCCEDLRREGKADEAKALRSEEAYALYRLGRYGPARDMCRSALKDAGFDPKDLSPDAPPGLAHTYAQSLYRLGETRAARRAYSNMLEGESKEADHEEDEEEVLANFLAASCSNRTYAGAPLSDVESALASRAESKINGGEEGTYNYDLACNLATLLLQSAASNAEVGRALNILSEAERGCVSASTDMAELMGEVGPIKAQTAYGHLLNGDEAKARSILTKLANNAKAGEGVTLAAGLNVALMDGKVEGVVSDLAGAKRTVVTPALVRAALLGRALVLLGKGDKDGCRAALVDLRSALEGSSGGGKKKKKGKTASSDNDVPAAPAASTDEARIWYNRIAMVESALFRSEGKADEADAGLKDALAKTEALAGASGREEDATALNYALTELLLYKSASSTGGEPPSAESAIAAIDALPAEIKSRPALRGAAASLHASTGRDDLAKAALEGGGGGSLTARAALADHLLRRGKYESAAEAYRALLDEAEDGSEPRAEIAAGLVRALSYSDPTEAVEVAGEELPELLDDDGGDGDSDINVEELEAREMPRIQSTGARGRGRLAGAAGGDGKGKDKKRSHSSVLRRRARLRAAHLSKLEAAGRIKPGAEPPKPDPDRWIPKTQRSYNKRGRRGRGRFTGAQGTGAGAEKDAAKLDAMARAKGGTVVETGGPSTANMKVASSGTGRRKGGRR